MARAEPGRLPPAPEGLRVRWRERLALHGMEYEIPPVATRLPYYLGSLTLTGIVLAGITGVYLAQFFQPSPIGAHSSVVYIVERAPFGDLARNLHWWASNAAVLGVLLHLSWVFYRGSYRPPRELTWWAGVGMLGCLFLLFFTGTTLPYHQEGYEALAHNVSVAEMMGPLGSILTGEFTPSTPLLARLYAFHISFLPLVLLALLGVHLYLIRHLGIHTQPGELAAGAFFRDHFRRIAAHACWLAAALLALSLLWPRALGFPAIPGVEVTKPPAPFLWMVALENWWGVAALAVVVPVGFLALVAVPLIDRRRSDSPRGRRWRLAGIAAAWAVLLGLTFAAALAPQQQHIGM
ncbi:MAG: cytochrome b N-terminal domain-containing protein [Gemmatimonadetes bacterium]|nr:cytochrome b N-terminal domain-containing protein [Gemmatimonadota bacterium]